MKKYIELNSVHFISTNGITLTNENPRIEASEENIEKLKELIDKLYLKIIEVNDDSELTEFKVQEEIKVPDDLDEHYQLPDTVSRYPMYSNEEIDDMNKKELLELCDILEIEEAKTNMKVAELKELIKKFYEE